MYLPTIIPSDIRTDWMHASSSKEQQRDINANKSKQNSSVASRGRRSDFPSLSFYTPAKASPLFLNSYAKQSMRYLKNSKTGSNQDEKQEDDRFEGLEQLSLELGNRLQSLKEIEIWGYTKIKPLGIDKTMSEMLQEKNNERDAINNDDTPSHRESETNNDIDDNDFAEAGAGNINGDVAIAHDSALSDTQNHTHLMAENLGQMQRNDNTAEMGANDNITSESDRNASNSLHRNLLNTTDYDDLGDDARDLDAEISNHDIGDNFSGISAYHEYDDAFYGDDDEFLEEEDDEEEHSHNHDGAQQDRYQLGLHGDNNHSGNLEADACSEVGADNIDHYNADRSVLYSSFLEGAPVQSQHLIRKNKTTEGEDEGYFMAYEDYQDDHSILDRKMYKSNNFGNLYTTDNAHSRRSAYSSRRYADSATLTTPTTVASNTRQSMTEDTSVDAEIHGSDFDMTLE